MLESKCEVGIKKRGVSSHRGDSKTEEQGEGEGEGEEGAIAGVAPKYDWEPHRNSNNVCGVERERERERERESQRAKRT